MADDVSTHPGSWVGDTVEEFKKLPTWGKIAVGVVVLAVAALGYYEYTKNKGSSTLPPTTGSTSPGGSDLGIPGGATTNANGTTTPGTTPASTGATGTTGSTSSTGTTTPTSSTSGTSSSASKTETAAQEAAEKQAASTKATTMKQSSNSTKTPVVQHYSGTKVQQPKVTSTKSNSNTSTQKKTSSVAQHAPLQTQNGDLIINGSTDTGLANTSSTGYSFIPPLRNDTIPAPPSPSLTHIGPGSNIR